MQLVASFGSTGKLIKSIMEAEEWMAKCKDHYSKFYTVRATWIHYTSGASGTS